MTAEKRRSPMRRQWNEAFCGPDGRFSVGKFLAVWAQIVVLAQMGVTWERLIQPDNSLTLLIVLAFLICPDLIKKALLMRLGK